MVGVIKALGTVLPIAPNSNVVKAHLNPVGSQVSDSEYYRDIHVTCNSSKYLHTANHVPFSCVPGILRGKQVNIQPCPKEAHGLVGSSHKSIITGIYPFVLKTYVQQRVARRPRRTKSS